MKKIIILSMFAVMAISCNKSKIRTCTVTPYSGDKYIMMSPVPMTRSEANEYEQELVLQTTQNGVPKSQYSKVSCK